MPCVEGVPWASPITSETITSKIVKLSRWGSYMIWGIHSIDRNVEALLYRTSVQDEDPRFVSSLPSPSLLPSPVLNGIQTEISSGWKVDPMREADRSLCKGLRASQACLKATLLWVPNPLQTKPVVLAGSQMATSKISLQVRSSRRESKALAPD
jgi:hypothetical protein